MRGDRILRETTVRDGIEYWLEVLQGDRGRFYCFWVCWGAIERGPADPHRDPVVHPNPDSPSTYFNTVDEARDDALSRIATHHATVHGT